MNTLLVPVDFSDATRHVIAAAAEFARKFKSKVILLHVIQPPPPITNDFSLPVGTLQEVALISEKAAIKRLERYAARLRAARIKTDVQVLQGPPGACVTDEAKRVKADCIIIGSHGHGKLYDIFVGSTASSVIKHATCAVHLLPRKKK